MTQHETICSNDYVDLVVEYTSEVASMVESVDDIHCFHFFGDEYGLLHVHKSKMDYFLDKVGDKARYDFPLPMGLMDEIGLAHSGIESIHNQPYLQLKGTGVLVGIIDTGIDYLHPAFMHPDNTTRIFKIWDQTIEGTPPDDFFLGHEYTLEDINRALSSQDPYSIVAHKDTDGHGTFMSGVAAGYDKAANFSGVAPNAELIIVKIKPSKQNLKEHWMLFKENIKVFNSTDIILALRYIAKVANGLGKPVAMNCSFGTNQGPHDNSGISTSAMEDISRRRGVALIGAAGNESIARHHARGKLSEHEMSYDIELRTGDKETGCCLEIWIPTPDIMSVVVKSPLNEYVEMLPKKFISVETNKLLFERTVITIEYHLANFKNGDQVILIKFKDPTPGIWTVTLKSHVYLEGHFDAWIPLKGWIEDDTVFINPDPGGTVTMPGTFSSLITVGAYNHRDESIYIDSSRGPSRIGRICPDLVAPGVNITAPWPNKEYAASTGTSAASAMITGCAALLLEWAIVREHDPSMNTYKVRNYLIGGARRERNISYPNNIWGYGKLDLQGAFNMMKL